MKSALKEIKDAGTTGCSTKRRGEFALACLKSNFTEGITVVAKLGLPTQVIETILSKGIKLE